MGWSSDWLYSLLLNQARETLAEAICIADERSEDRPLRLFATEHTEWNRDLNMTSGSPVRIWSSEDDFSSLIDPSAWQTIGSNRSTQGRSIHRIPLFSWFIAENRKQILICRWIGPLYGNGGWWDVLSQGRSGRLSKAKRGGWIS